MMIVIFLLVLLFPGIATAQLGQIPLNTWYELSLANIGHDTHMNQYCPSPPAVPPSDIQPGLSCSDNGPLVYSGAVLDEKRNRLIVFGGGHGDYAGNEVYSFSLNDFTWSRIVNNSVGDDIPLYPGGVDPYYDGKPASRHSYDNMVYIPRLDKIFMAGGGIWSGSGGGTRTTWYLNLATNPPSWERQTDISEAQSQAPQAPWIAYDPVTDKAYMASDKGVVMYWDPNAAPNGWGVTAADGNVFTNVDGDLNAALDPINRVIVFVGNSTVYAFYPGSPASSAPKSITSGPTNCITNTGGGGKGPGLVWDSNLQSLVLYCGGTTLYKLNTSTWAITPINAAEGSPTPDPSRWTIGIPDDPPFRVYGRFNYLPDRNLYIYVPDNRKNVWVYRASQTKWHEIATITPWVNYGVKHVNVAQHPDGTFYITGGDYVAGSWDSYVQRSYKLDFWQKLINPTNAAAGLTTVYGDCGAANTIQPKAPDFVGWYWRAVDSRFYFVPGLTVAGCQTYSGGQCICPGETNDGLTNEPDATHAGYYYHHVMTFNPSNNTWADVGPSATDIGDDQWLSVYDPITDKIYLWKGAWIEKFDPANPSAGWQIINGSGTDVDWKFTQASHSLDVQAKTVYAVGDARGTNPRLKKYKIDTNTQTDLGPLPGGALTDPWGQPILVWDKTDKVLFFVRHPHTTGDYIYTEQGQFYAYHPEEYGGGPGGSWETLSVGVQESATRFATGTIVAYDEFRNQLLLFSDFHRDNYGQNYLYVYSYGAGGSQSQQDTEQPTIALSSPVSATNPPTPSASYGTTQPTINVSGTCTDNTACASVDWVSDRSGKGSATGSFPANSVSWSANGIALQVGVNSITFTARDQAGNPRDFLLAITYTPIPGVAYQGAGKQESSGKAQIN